MLLHGVDQTCEKTAQGKKKRCISLQEIATLLLVEPLCFGVYSIPFELLVSGIILFGAWKESESADEKAVAVKPGFGCLQAGKGFRRKREQKGGKICMS